MKTTRYINRNQVICSLNFMSLEEVQAQLPGVKLGAYLLGYRKYEGVYQIFKPQDFACGCLLRREFESILKAVIFEHASDVILLHKPFGLSDLKIGETFQFQLDRGTDKIFLTSESKKFLISDYIPNVAAIKVVANWETPASDAISLQSFLQTRPEHTLGDLKLSVISHERFKNPLMHVTITK